MSTISRIYRRLYDSAGLPLPSGVPVVVREERSSSPARLYGNSSGTVRVSNVGQTYTIADGYVDVYAQTGRSYTLTAKYNGVDLPASTTSSIYPGDQYDPSDKVVGGGDAATTNPGVVPVAATDTATQLKTAIETIRAASIAGSPFGRGRVVQVDGTGGTDGSRLLPPSVISTMQSIQGSGNGGTVLTLDPTGLAVGEHAQLELAADFSSRKGIKGQGSIRDLTFNGDKTTWSGAAPGVIVHGYRGLARVGGGVAHYMENVGYQNYTGHGIYLRDNNDQLIGMRLRAEDNDLFGFFIANCSDVKLSNLGSISRTGAMWIQNSAVEVDTFDMFIPPNATCEGTLHLQEASRVQMRNGTISGRTVIRGKNDQGTTVRYENSHILFEGVNFKYDADLRATKFYENGTNPTFVYDSYLQVEDTDGVKLSGCRFGFEYDMLEANKPDYYIKVNTSTGTPDRAGGVHLSQATGLIGRMGRVGQPEKMIVGFKKHYSNNPRFVMFDGFVPGEPELVRNELVDNSGQNIRTHIPFGGTYPKADYPLGYLFATLHTGGTLDDGQVNFTLPALTSPYSGFTPCLRVIP